MFVTCGAHLLPLYTCVKHGSATFGTTHICSADKYVVTCATGVCVKNFKKFQFGQLGARKSLYPPRSPFGVMRSRMRMRSRAEE